MDIEQLFSSGALNRMTKNPFVQNQNVLPTPPETADFIVTESGLRLTSEDGNQLITED